MMKLRLLRAAAPFVLALSLTSPTLAAPGPAPSPAPGAVITPGAQPSPELLAQAKIAAERGKLIYAFDQAAWYSTDVMQERIPARLRSLTAPGGWVVEGDLNRQTVTYYSGDKAFFVADMRGGEVLSTREVKADDPAAPLTPVQKRMAAAKATAFAEAQRQNLGICANAVPNTVTLPPVNAEAPIDIYLLTPQPALNLFPVGGHYLMKIGADGKVISTKRFANSCVTLNNRPAGLPAGSSLAALAVTHLLDDAPTEIHFFTSLAAKTRLMVSTTSNGIGWWVNGGELGSPPEGAGAAPGRAS